MYIHIHTHPIYLSILDAVYQYILRVFLLGLDMDELFLWQVTLTVVTLTVVVHYGHIKRIPCGMGAGLIVKPPHSGRQTAVGAPCL